MEIVPGLFQLKTPMMGPALPYIMPYALRGSDGVNLIDTGFGTPDAIESLTTQLKSLGYEPSQIRRLFITHAHPDHIGMAGWVKEQSPDCEVIMLEREWQWIQDRWLNNDAWTALSDAWLVRHGVPQDEVDAAQAAGALSPTSPSVKPGETAPAPAAAPRPGGSGRPFSFIEPDVKLQDGDIVEFDGWRLQAVWTPGHTPGSTCFVAREAGVAFVGDLVISYRDGLARSMVAANRDDRRYLGALGAFAGEARALGVTMGMPGHGHPIRSEFAERLEELSTLPREPLSPRNFWRRTRRMARFNTFMWMKDRPRR